MDRAHETGLKLSDLKTKLGRIGVKHILIHLDCCHAGGVFFATPDMTADVPEETRSAPSPALEPSFFDTIIDSMETSPKSTMRSRALLLLKPSPVVERMAKSPAVQAVTAVTATEQAIERGEHGIFTQAICEQLTSGEIFKKQQHPYVKGDELFSSARDEVIRQVASLGCEMTPMYATILTKHGGEQCAGQMLFFQPDALGDGTGVAGVSHRRIL